MSNGIVKLLMSASKSKSEKRQPRDKTQTKAAIARRIYDEMCSLTQRPSRQEIIGRFMSEAGLTQHGANTYLGNFDKQAGRKVYNQPIK